MTPLQRSPVPVLEGNDGVAVTLPGGALAPSALEQLLAKGRLRATLAMLGPAFVAAVAVRRPGQLRDQHPGWRQVRLPAAVGGARRQPDRDAHPIPIRQARHRLRPRPAAERARPLLTARRVGHVDPGGDHRDVDRHRRVPRRRARPQPAVRGPAAAGGLHHRRDRVRDPRPSESRLPPLRARDHGAARDHLPGLPVRGAARSGRPYTAR